MRIEEARMEQARQEQLQQYYHQMKAEAQRGTQQPQYEVRAEPPRANGSYNPVYHHN
jgi:hypothetical protein